MPCRHLHRRRALSALPVSLLALIAALALGAGPASAATACASARLMPAVQNLDQVEGTVLCLLNQERTQRGLKPLRADTRLGRAASRFSRAMVAGNFFSHVSPGGSTLVSRVKRTGYLRGANGWSIGENIAFGTGRYATPEETVDAWMRSPAHRASILRPGFREIGIGIALGAPGQDGGATYTTDFGTRL